MRKLFTLIVAFTMLTSAFLLFGTSTAKAQSIIIEGTVTDLATGLPLPGVEVTVSGTNTGVITDGDGKYRILIPNSGAVLKYEYVGYKVLTKVTTNLYIIDVALEESE